MILFKYILRPLVLLLGAFPARLRAAIGGFMGGLVSLIPTREREIAKLQMEIFLPRKVRRPSLWSVYANYGINIAEAINLTSLTKIHVTPELREQYRRVVQDPKKPVVILTGHTSNWDLMGAMTVGNFGSFATVGRKARIGIFQSLLEFIRTRYGIITLWKDTPNVSKELVRLLHGGTPIAALIDQDTYVASKPIPLFGEPAQTPYSLVSLAQRTEANVFSMFLGRVAPSRYELIVERIDSSEPIEEILTKYHHHLEKYLTRFPEQWVWVHKRWRTLPDGTRRNSKEYLKYLREKLKEQRA